MCRPSFLATMQYFQIHSKIPELTEEMIRKIPEHRATVDRFIQTGRIVAYGVSADRTELWITVYAADEIAALDLIGNLPLAEFLHPDISPLMFHLTPDMIKTPSWN